MDSQQREAAQRPRLDHVLTFAQAPSIDAYVEQYRALGFVVSEETHRYQPGLRNRFIHLGCEYLELVWVEDEARFARGGAEEFARMFSDLPALRQAARPFSIGFVTEDVAALHQQWTRQGYALPEVWSFAPPGRPPILSFQVIPEALLPGASCFAITYHSASTAQVRAVQRAANTIYAAEGITCVSTTPEDAARSWQTLLYPEAPISVAPPVSVVSVPPHTIWWMSPDRFQARYGITWRPAPHQYGQLAAIYLLAEDLAVASAMVAQRVQCRISTADQGDVLVVVPTGADGVTLIIREYPLEQWRSERERATGETISVS
jgi:hypothetical protein